MFQLLSFIRYLFFTRSRAGAGIPDPFVAQLLTCCLRSSRHKSNRIAENIRAQAGRSGELLEVEDHGAGTRKHLSHIRPLGKIMRQTAISRKSGQILSAVAAYYRPVMILELGTGLGISTLYMACGNPAARIITIEGSSEIAKRASMHFKTAGYNNIRVTEGKFDDILPAVLSEKQHPLMVFIDGDHRRSGLLDNISLLMPVIQDDSILVIDDIHLSREMDRAWSEIISMPEVCLSVDLFRLGLLFFRKEICKQHLVMRI